MMQAGMDATIDFEEIAVPVGYLNVFRGAENNHLS